MTNFYLVYLVHMTNMAVRHKFGKRNLSSKNIDLQNPKAYDLETWCVALGAHSLL